MKNFEKMSFPRNLKIAFFAFVLALFAASVPAGAQQFSSGNFKKISQEEGAAVLKEFREFRVPGDYCMEFEIVHKPRKIAEEIVFSGTIFGTWKDDGARILLEIRQKNASPETTKKFILQNGKNPELWTLGNDGNAVKIDEKSTSPFLENLIFTPFDLQTPFLFWENFAYESTKRSRGRVAYFFKMFPPENFENPDISYVKIALDRVYHVLLSVEIFGRGNEKLKNFSVSGVKKIQGVYTFRELELRDERSRDRETLVVKRAAMNLRFSPEVFSPENLSKQTPKIPDSLFEKVD